MMVATRQTDNYKKHRSNNPIQRLLINNFYKTIIQALRSLPIVTVLDVGAGEGFTLKKFEDEGIGKLREGVEYSDTAIALAKKLHPLLPIKKGSIYELPYNDNSFDLVVCTEVLEHLDDPKKALAELIRVSKMYCLLTVPNEPLFMLLNLLRGKNVSRLGNDVEHIHHWSFWGFYSFVSKKIPVKHMFLPIPWTVIIAQKA